MTLMMTVNEDATITKTGSEEDVLNDGTKLFVLGQQTNLFSVTLTVTKLRKMDGSNSAVSSWKYL